MGADIPIQQRGKVDLHGRCQVRIPGQDQHTPSFAKGHQKIRRRHARCYSNGQNQFQHAHFACQEDTRQTQIEHGQPSRSANSMDTNVTVNATPSVRNEAIRHFGVDVPSSSVTLPRRPLKLSRLKTAAAKLALPSMGRQSSDRHRYQRALISARSQQSEYSTVHSSTWSSPRSTYQARSRTLETMHLATRGSPRSMCQPRCVGFKRICYNTLKQPRDFFFQAQHVIGHFLRSARALSMSALLPGFPDNMTSCKAGNDPMGFSGVGLIALAKETIPVSEIWLNARCNSVR